MSLGKSLTRNYTCYTFLKFYYRKYAAVSLKVTVYTNLHVKLISQSQTFQLYLNILSPITQTNLITSHTSTLTIPLRLHYHNVKVHWRKSKSRVGLYMVMSKINFIRQFFYFAAIRVTQLLLKHLVCFR